MISGEEVVELLPALACREPTGGYLFYDCQTDDVRLVLTVLAEAERFGAICANRLEVRELALERGRADRRAGPRRRRAAASSSSAPRTSINATGVWADGSGPASCTPTPRCRGSARAAARTSRSSASDLPLVAGAIVPAGENRTIFALPWLGRSLIGTTDNNYDGDLDHVQPDPARHRLPA